MLDEQKRHINDGTLCLIEPEPLTYVKEYLFSFNPKLIIELGTHRGGFTKYLTMWFPDVWIYTVDIDYMLSEDDAFLFKHRKVVKLLLDIFNEPFLLETLVRSKERKFLFCDNGNKPREVEKFAPLLNVGDLLAVHDWGGEIFPDEVQEDLANYIPCSVNHVIGEISQLRFFSKVRD